MKIAIVYKSITGNTKIIANAIKEALSEQEIIYFGEPKDNINADIYIVGSWTDKGECSKEIKTYLSNLENKKIIYFGTAGFNGKGYYEMLYDRVRKNIKESNKVLGYFYCQGKMPMSVKDRYINLIKEHPDDKRLQVSIDNFNKALTHPDNTDVENAKHWIKSIIN